MLAPQALTSLSIFWNCSYVAPAFLNAWYLFCSSSPLYISLSLKIGAGSAWVLSVMEVDVEPYMASGTGFSRSMAS